MQTKKGEGKGYFYLQISEERMQVCVKSDWRYFSRIISALWEEARFT